MSSPDEQTTPNGHTTADDGSKASASAGKGNLIVKLVILAGVVAAFVYLYTYHRDELTLESIAQRRAQFNEFREEHPVGVYGAAFAVYAVATGLSIPGAAVLTLAYGWFFGFWRGVIVVSFGSTTGATLAFLLSRYLLRDTVQQRFTERVRKFDEALAKEGPFYLFTLRLIPAVPFWLLNLAAGLTPMRVWTYWWVSQLGMLPGTAVYVYAGSAIPTAEELAEHGMGGILTWEVITAFVILGLFPLVVKKVMARFAPEQAKQEMSDGKEDAA